MNIWTAAAGLAVLCLASGVADAQEKAIELVTNGQSDYVIVLHDPSPSEQWAAEELADHVEQMSGARLPVVTSPAQTPPRAVYIGAAFDDGAAELGTDGYVVRTSGPKLVIAGGRRRGTLYGVYTLLESLGVRWWAVGETFVPHKPNIVIEPTDIRNAPVLEYRDMMFGDLWGADGQLWMARNKLNGMQWDDAPEKLGGRYKFVGNLVHSYMHLLRDSGHEITDNMKALVNGRRTSAQPCLSSQATVEAMTAGVLKAFEETPDARFVVVGQMDNGSYCRCEDCAAIDEAEEAHSGQVIRFANRVAEAVEKARPGSEIATAAYSWSRKPPKNLRPRDNVRIVLCSIECDFAHPLADASNPENKAFKEDIEGWREIAGQLLIWNYIGNREHYLLPNPELDTLVPNTKFFVDNNVIGIFEQGTHVGTATDMAPLKKWVLAKALWNPEADGPGLIREFVNGYYGAAGPAIRKYIDVMHRTGREQDFHLGRRVRLNAPFLRPEIVVEAEAALRQAAELAKDQPLYARRVRHAHMGTRYLLAKCGPDTATWRAVEERFGDIDFPALSAEFERTVEEYGIDKINDPAPIGPWLHWLEQYAAMTEAQGLVVPPELADEDPADFRLIQACQMDARAGWWAPSEGASDGWAVHVPGRGWHTNTRFNTWNDITPGKQYKLYVRARARMEAGPEGEVWQFGVYPRGRTVNIQADALRDGKWHVFETPAWDAREGQYFWTALMPDADGVEAVEVDCIWLREAE